MFDRVVVVDWSASSRPTRGRDSIWIGVADGSSDTVLVSNPSTRAEAIAQMGEWCRRPGSTLLGVDFSLGYPSGTTESLGLSGVPWRAMWDLLAQLIDDRDDNANNRFEVAAELNRRVGPGPGPFWGCPPSRRSATLTSTKVAPTPLDEWRRVEYRLRDSGHRPFSGWQLLGAGSVGSQSLLGIPRTDTLLRSLVSDGRSVAVWPFSGSIERDAVPDVVIAEVWPSLHRLPPLDGRVRDEVQVASVARRLVHTTAADLVAPACDAVVAEEGWVLGA